MVGWVIVLGVIYYRWLQWESLIVSQYNGIRYVFAGGSFDYVYYHLPYDNVLLMIHIP